MTKLGWGILAGIVLAAALFLSMLSFSAAPPGSLRDRVRQAIPPRHARPGMLVVPVAGTPFAALRDSWGEARSGGTREHRGLDIEAPRGTAVVAAAGGVVEKLFRSDLGGTTLYVRSPDLRWIYYYAHLAGYAPRIVEGRRVQAGQVIGYVGDTGDAGTGNYHLHFGMQRMRAGERWWQGDDVDPYPLLAAGSAGR